MPAERGGDGRRSSGGGRPDGRGRGGPGGGSSSSGGSSGGRGGRPSGEKPAGRSGGGRPAGGRGAVDGARSGGRDGGGRGGRPSGPGADRTRRPDRDREERVPRSDDQERYDGPELPEEITGKELDRSVMAQLQSLPEKLAIRVARHLAAAGLVLADDPETAYLHTLAAKARAGRLAVVREAVGEAAYAAGHFQEALTELKAARRMNGARDYVAMIADSERALGRPDKALELVRAVNRETLSKDLVAELTIVESGARRDRGELDAALRVLEQAQLNSPLRVSWVARLRYAYADALLAAGRAQEALEWFHRTEGVDTEQVTDAPDRIAELERTLSD